MSKNLSGLMTRRDFIRALGVLGATVVLEGCATPTVAPTIAPTTAPAAPTSPPAPTMAPAQTTVPAPTSVPTATQVKPTVAAGRPDWVTAAKPFQGRTVYGIGSKGDFTEYWAKRADEFNKLTGVKVQTELIAAGDPYWAKLQSELRGRSGNVSFFVVDAGNLSLYQEAGALQPLDAYLSDPKFPDWEAKDYSPSVLDMLSLRKGKAFALPVNGDVQTMYYRKDLFDAAGLKVPKTWQELYEAAKKLRKGDVWAAAWEMTGRYAAIRFGNALAPGLTWLDKDMRLSALRDPRTIEIMGIWVRLLKEELIPGDTLSLDPRGVETLFATGRAAILPIAWPSQIAIFEDPTKSKVAGNVATALVPGGEANASGMAVSVSSDAKEKEAAYLFISWLTSKETCTKNAVEYQDMGSLRDSVASNPAVEQMFLKRADGKSQLACYTTKAEALKKARFAPAIAQWSGPCINAMAPIFQKIMAGATPVDKGMNEAADAAEKILQEAGYYK